MPRPRYQWRQLTLAERDEILASRVRKGHPWHSPPHRAGPAFDDSSLYHVTAACYDHLPVIGASTARMDEFSDNLIDVIGQCGARCCAWCVLPNHYHALVDCSDVIALLRALGRLHGRSSFKWNGEDGTRGRKVFFRAAERTMRSDGHVWATVNYIHNNPVRHAYVDKWMAWPWSSARQFVSQVGRVEAERMWRCYPVREYGEGWDDPEL